MNLEQALQALAEREKKFLSRIPAQASAMRKRYLREMVEEEVDAARTHLRALYQSRLEVGPELGALDTHRNHTKYAFWMEGIHRHLAECEAILAEQPDAGKTAGR
jgi:hypothetical protein